MRSDKEGHFVKSLLWFTLVLLTGFLAGLRGWL